MSIASKIGCRAGNLRGWLRQTEGDQRVRSRLPNLRQDLQRDEEMAEILVNCIPFAFQRKR